MLLLEMVPYYCFRYEFPLWILQTNFIMFDFHYRSFYILGKFSSTAVNMLIEYLMICHFFVFNCFLSLSLFQG